MFLILVQITFPLFRRAAMAYFSIKYLQLNKSIVEYAEIPEDIPWSFELNENMGSRSTHDALKRYLVAMQFYFVLMSNCLTCD